jgi:hypothetical protein
MQVILFEYEMHPTTWFYLSSLMIIGIFFKFYRLFSVRNLDLLGLIAFTPGLLLIAHQQDAWGYAWLFTVGCGFLVRLLLDPIMVRRPLLEPNLNASGLTFTGAALLVFLIANVITGRTFVGGSHDASGRAVPLEKILLTRAAEAKEGGLADRGPGYPWFYDFADLSGLAADSEAESDGPAEATLFRRDSARTAAARTAAILGHLAVVLGIVLIGYRHFDNLQTGVAAASLYLLLPYTSQMTGRVDHVIPAVFLVWAMEAYRRPLAAGILIGLAGGLIFYPLFLIPLWLGFYWQRGGGRFAVGVVSALLFLIGLSAFAPGHLGSFADQLQRMFGATSLPLELPDGFWKNHEQAYRIPVLAGFLALCGGLALWPAQKNLGTLLSCSAAVLLGAQFWHAHQGGLYMGWYLPLLVLTIFRPNLEDRVALTAVNEDWRIFRKTSEA